MCLQFDLLFWPVCLQICGPKSGEILRLTPLIRVNFRETAFKDYALQGISTPHDRKSLLCIIPKKLLEDTFKNRLYKLVCTLNHL